MSEFLSVLQQTSGLQWLLVIVCMLLVWFLPAMLALVSNRNQAKIIFLACIPAGFSVVAWCALLAWAVTGKAIQKYLPQNIKRRLAQSE